MRRKSYMFTNRSNPERGIMSTVLGILSVVAIGLTVFSSYKHGGAPNARLGVTILVSLIFGFTGLVLGILSRLEPDKFYLFPNIGIGLNALAILASGFIIYAGVVGL